MDVSYKLLWVELAKTDMKKYEFQEMSGISSNLLDNIGKMSIF